MVGETTPKNPINLIFDTNSLRALNFEKEIAPLLGACKDGIVSLYICEPVIYERARQYYDDNKKRVMPVDYTLLETIAWFKELFVSHNVNLLETDREHIDIASKLIDDENTYYNIDNINDKRDALIFSMAVTSIKTDNAVVLCEENALRGEFENNGFTVRNDTKTYINEILSGFDSRSFNRPSVTRIQSSSQSGVLNPPLFDYLESADPTYHSLLEEELKALPVTDDKLTAKIIEMKNVDSELLKRILGYVQWFSPISKKDLNDMLNDRFDSELITNLSERLCINGLLNDTGGHLIPNDKDKDNKEICVQAMSSVIDEILNRLELD